MTNITDRTATKFRITLRGNIIREVHSRSAADAVIEGLNESDRMEAVVTTVTDNGNELLLG